MENLQKIHALSSFMMGKEDKLKEALAEAQQLIRKKLRLPDEIRLTGLTFDHDSDFKAESLHCAKTCTKMGADGQLHVFCCPPR